MDDEPDKKTICIILGPTAAGKSALGYDAALDTDAEIISIDSMQVYRGMDVGTAKPAAQERARVPHHLIDIRDPWESFSAAEYVRLADAAIEDVTNRGATPLLVGGTALYIKSLLLGIFDGPSADWEFRQSLREEAARVGSEELHKRLADVDPDAAGRIHPNDLRRIERALEIHHKTGGRASALRREWARGKRRHDARIVGIRRPRAELTGRIDARVDRMIAAGWIEEVRRLMADPRGLSREASQALGYLELARAVKGETSLDAAIAEIKKRTRRFAKAQMTWFKAFPDVTWFEGGALDAGDASLDEVMSALGLGEAGRAGGGRARKETEGR